MTGTALHDVAKRRDHDPVQFNTGFTEFPPPVLHHPMRVSPPVNRPPCPVAVVFTDLRVGPDNHEVPDRKSTRLNSSHVLIAYAVFCLKKKMGAGARPADVVVNHRT